MVRLRIRQEAIGGSRFKIRLTLTRPDVPDIEGEAEIEFTLSEQEREDLRWYLEDYLEKAEVVEPIVPKQIEAMMKAKGEELYTKVLAANPDTQAIWFAIREQLADLRVEITTGVVEAASIPWELMRDPASDSAIALRAESFVHVQSNPSTNFVKVPELYEDGRVRLLYVVCRPSGVQDVALRAVANRILQGLAENLSRFDIKALRPPTWQQLQTELRDAKEAGRPYHIVHFDGHGVYADLSQTGLADWANMLSSITLGAEHKGKHGFLLFEEPDSEEKMRPVHGQQLGQLLRDTNVPCLILNACQSAMHEACERPQDAKNVHDEVRAIGSLAQSVIDQGIPAVLGMRYSVYVVTAAQYIGELYANLAKGRGFGQAASEGRKHLHANPERWLGLEPRPLRDWFVPIVYEAAELKLLPPNAPPVEAPELDPINLNPSLVRYVPDSGFIGRDETLLLLDRALDKHPVVLLHAYAGQGKTSTAVEFARWYSLTKGLGETPLVIFTSFETYTTLNDILDQLGQQTVPDWTAINEPEKKFQVIQQVLRQISVLWIWDNVEAVAGFPVGTESVWNDEEQADLADFLKLIKLDPATKARFLFTSRREEDYWLREIPHRIQMSRMRNPDAFNLALRIGSEKKLSRRDIAEWKPLLDYCDGNPLTLRILIGQAVNAGLFGKEQISEFVQAIRDGEEEIQDADKALGRDKSLGASLNYGFLNTFDEPDLAVIALLHLFQGVVDVDALHWMGHEKSEHSLSSLREYSKEDLERLLQQASNVGLLGSLNEGRYRIHPALPWFLTRLFKRYYPDENRQASNDHIWLEDRELKENGRRLQFSTASSAMRSWVQAIGGLGDHYHRQFFTGNREAVYCLNLEEDNLLQARRICLSRADDETLKWWAGINPVMRGLSALYEYQGRSAEWSRLVREIMPLFCTKTDEEEFVYEPIVGRESEYRFVVQFRVTIAIRFDHDLDMAEKLQQSLVALDKRDCQDLLNRREDEQFDEHERHRIRNLCVGLENLGNILIGRGDHECVTIYEESIRLAKRIGDAAAEAVAQFNLGRAYRDLSQDLAAAEIALKRSMALRPDRLGRARCIQVLATVYHERLREELKAGKAEITGNGLGKTETRLQSRLEKVSQLARQAEEHYLQALEMCSLDAVSDLSPIYCNLGQLYQTLGELESARKYFEKG